MLFETSRLTVRLLEEQDYGNFQQMQSSPNVMKFILGRAKSREENSEEWQRIGEEYAKEDPELLVMAVCSNQSRELVGTCAIVKNEEEEYEVGYRFWERYWGSGFGREVLEGLIGYAFLEMNLTSLVAYVHLNNVSSVKILDQSCMHVTNEFIEKETNDEIRKYEITRQEHINLQSRQE